MLSLSKEKSKFQSLFESIQNRYVKGSGYLPGDAVKLTKNFASNDWVKNQAESIKQLLNNLSKTENNLIICYVKTKHPMPLENDSPTYFADISEVLCPGRYANAVTVPISILELVTPEGTNLPDETGKINSGRNDASLEKSMEQASKEQEVEMNKQTQGNKRTIDGKPLKIVKR